MIVTGRSRQITGAVLEFKVLQSIALGNTRTGIRLPILTAHRHIMRGTVAGKARVGQVRDARDGTLFLCTSCLSREATANVALHVEPRTVGDRPARQIARVIGDAGHRLAVLNMPICIAPTDLQAALESGGNSHKSVDRHEVIRRLAQGTSGYAFVSLWLATIQLTHLIRTRIPATRRFHSVDLCVIDEFAGC